MNHFVLVVDDDESLRIALRSVLEEAGHRVVGAKDGVEALEQLAKDDLPDLVLLDLMMPRLNGWRVVEAMRASPRLRWIPVVILSSLDGCDEAPASRIMLHKPLDAEVLLDVVGDVLSQGNAAPAARLRPRQPAHSHGHSRP